MYNKLRLLLELSFLMEPPDVKDWLLILMSVNDSPEEKGKVFSGGK